VTNPATGQAAIPRIPGERDLPEAGDGRRALADWLTADDNPYFARAMVNRLWKALMGRGLVEPTDDLRATNPATHPRLLDKLAADFVANGYDLRHTMREIATSAAYGRAHSNESLGDLTAGEKFYARALWRPLEAEVFLDALSDVTGVWESHGEAPLGTRAIELVGSQTPSLSLDILGRCSRSESCESGPPILGVPAKLHFLNGPLMNRKVAAAEGRLAAALNAGRSDGEIIDEFYWRALGRPPSAAESEFWRREVASENQQERRKRLEDFLWAMLNSREFATNH
jgi:hypothetical protein